MLIIPAIDIRRGNCVRLYQGRQEMETIYSNNPIEMAQLWKLKGATLLHIADLDGAFDGKPINLPLIQALRSDVQIPVEVGGGYRDMASITSAYERGIDKVILGTVAIENPELVAEAIGTYNDFVTVSIDVRGTFATASGWKKTSVVSSGELATRMRELGISELFFTDTTRDGTLQGPDIATIRAFLSAAQVPVTVSGGISSLEDIQNLKELEGEGLKGVVIGKALYDKKFELEEALRLA